MNQKPIRTIIYGRSIIMAGLEESMRKHKDFSVQKRIEFVSDVEQMKATDVDLFLFDNALPEVKRIESILSEKPGILTLGLDIGSRYLNVIPPKGIPIENFIDLANLIFKLINRQSEINQPIYQGEM